MAIRLVLFSCSERDDKVDRKKLRAYFMIFCVSVLISIYLPSLIDLCSQRMVDGMVSETEETEATTESGPGIAGTLPGTNREETDGSSDEAETEGHSMQAGKEEAELRDGQRTETDFPTSAAEIQKQKEERDAGLQKFRQSFHPEITEAYSGVQEAFIGDHAVEFDHAIADHIYQAYGDLYNVTQVELKEMLDETNDEIRCMVRVYTKSGDRNYSQDYIVVYSKAYDFYSVYAYNR